LCQFIVCLHAEDVAAQQSLVEQLLNHLDTQVALATADIANVVGASPVHALLECLCAVLSIAAIDRSESATWSQLVKRTIALTDAAAAIACPFVTTACPDGVLGGDSHPDVDANPLTLQEEDWATCGGDSAAPGQALLLCTWRIMKQASHMWLFLATHICVPPWTFLASSELTALGERLFSLLCTCRHKGAVDALANVFEVVCRRLWLSTESDSAALPFKWLDSVLHLITAADAASVTRRSAGYPALIHAILATAPNDVRSRDALCAVDTLLALACAGDSAPLSARIHALNVLRFLVRDSQVILTL
jgi:hypothetical protein